MNTFFQSPAFNFIKKAAAVSIFYTVGVVVTAVPNEEPEEQQKGDFQQYVEQNLESLIQEQEKALGITYPKERPRIYYSIPEEYPCGFYGLYDKETNEIFLMSDSFYHPFWNPAIAYDAAHHELGHWYCDTLSERLGKGNWPDYDKNMNFYEIVPRKLVSEGIATYIERTMSGEMEDTFSNEEWPKSIYGFIYSNEAIYLGGFHLVKPIIDLYGQPGIEYLMFHLPYQEELFDLPSYQQRILQELSTP